MKILWKAVKAGATIYVAATIILDMLDIIECGGIDDYLDPKDNIT